ncbi:hypothetical protein B0T13DRAFT_370940, partial [Neurospora crassa]
MHERQRYNGSDPRSCQMPVRVDGSRIDGRLRSGEQARWISHLTLRSNSSTVAGHYIRVLEEQAVSMVFWCAALSAERGKHLRLPNRHDGVVRSGQGLALDDRGGP